MRDHAELVKAWRYCAVSKTCDGCPMQKNCPEISHQIVAADAIEELLAAVPKRGEWIEDRMDYRCSVCGKTVKDEIFYMFEPYQFPPFCPNCGSRLEPPKEVE